MIAFFLPYTYVYNLVYDRVLERSVRRGEAQRMSEAQLVVKGVGHESALRCRTRVDVRFRPIADEPDRGSAPQTKRNMLEVTGERWAASRCAL